MSVEAGNVREGSREEPELEPEFGRKIFYLMGISVQHIVGTQLIFVVFF